MIEFLLRILAAVGKTDQRTCRDCACSLRAHRAIALKGVADLDHTAVVMRTDGDAAAHVDDDEVQVLVLLAVLLRIAACLCLLVQRMEDAGSLDELRSGIPCHICHLIGADGINDKGRNTDRVCDLTGQDAAKVRGVLSAVADREVVDEVIVHGIGAARDRTDQAAAADDDIKALHIDVLALKERENDVLSEILLGDDGIKLSDLLRGVAEGLVHDKGLILEDTDLRGGGSGVDNQTSDGHVVLLLSGLNQSQPVFFSSSATTAATAMELTLTSTVSERLVRTTGALVPMRMLPLTTPGTMWTIAL